jgi:hypothetical protein
MKAEEYSETQGWVGCVEIPALLTAYFVEFVLKSEI